MLKEIFQNKVVLWTRLVADNIISQYYTVQKQFLDKLYLDHIIDNTALMLVHSKFEQMPNLFLGDEVSQGNSNFEQCPNGVSLDHTIDNAFLMLVYNKFQLVSYHSALDTMNLKPSKCLRYKNVLYLGHITHK